MREFSHTCKSLTVKCCARFGHNIYFSSESSGLAAVITGRPNARHPPPPEKRTLAWRSAREVRPCDVPPACNRRGITDHRTAGPPGPFGANPPGRAHARPHIPRAETPHQRAGPQVGHIHARRETDHAPPFLIFFWTVRLKPHDRNRLNARATRCRTLKGSACSRTLRRPALSLDQTVQKKKIQGRHSTKERGTWASEPTP